MSDKPNIDYGWQSKDEPFFRKLQEINAPDVIGPAAPMPTVKDLMEALARFREVMTDTLERATQFLRDRTSDGVTDEDDDALLRECETVLEWAKSLPPKGADHDSQASGGTEHG